MHDIVAALYVLAGALLPLLGSAMIPNGSQRWGGAIFAGIGLFVFINWMTHTNSSPFSLGLGLGFALATAKLTTGIRFI